MQKERSYFVNLVLPVFQFEVEYKWPFRSCIHKFSTFRPKFCPYQDVDKFPKIISTNQTNLAAVDVIILLLFKLFKIPC